MPSKAVTSVIMTAVGIAAGVATYFRSRSTRKSVTRSNPVLTGIFASGATLSFIAFCQNPEEAALGLPMSAFIGSVAVMTSIDD